MKYFFVIFLVISSSVFGQKALFIEPIIGVAGSQAQHIQKSLFVEKKSEWREFIGLSLRLQSNPNWNFALAYHTANGMGASIGFRFNGEANLLNGKDECGARRCFYTLEKGLSQISGQVSRKIFNDIHFLPINIEQGLHLFVFDIGLIAGANYNFLWGTSSYNITGQATLTEGFQAQTNQLRNHNISTALGIFLQFKHFDKNTARLSFIYSRGLSDLLKAEINYQIGQNNYQHTFRHRGDVLMLQISIPIRIISF